MTWKQYVARRMGPLMRSGMSHGDAMRQLGRDWRARKKGTTMAKKKSLPAKRRTSPAVSRLKQELAKARSRAAGLRREVKSQGTGTAVLTSSGLVASGGGAAGALKGVLGDGMIGRGVAGGVGALAVLGGAFLIPGKFGSAIAAVGAGMAAKVLGDLAEAGVSNMMSTDEGE